MTFVDELDLEGTDHPSFLAAAKAKIDGMTDLSYEVPVSAVSPAMEEIVEAHFAALLMLAHANAALCRSVEELQERVESLERVVEGDGQGA